jgi:putative membrane protein
MRTLATCFVSLSLLLSSACKREETPPTGTLEHRGPAPTPAALPTDPAGQGADGTRDVPGSGAMSDAQIMAIVATANDGEIAAARLALQRATSNEVKQLAQLMLTEHTAMQETGTALAKELGLAPSESDQSRMLATTADTEAKRLSALEGAAFDKAYVDGQVAMHEGVLDTIDRKLVPSAQNPRLKTMLTDTRPKISGHLEHARKVQAQLAGPVDGKATPAVSPAPAK